ncbi:MAG: hypothetical protein WBF79_08800 [Rhodococcus sp. (in: high G+C Gram-positive bacteria)]
MKRSTVALDRVGVLIVGLALVAVGGGAALWQTDRLPFALSELDLSVLTDRQTEPWWPWALLGVGVVLILLLLLTLVKRIPSTGPDELSLDVVGEPEGTSTLDLRAVTRKAADAARGVHGVKSARSRLRVERSGKRKVSVITVAVRAEERAILRSVVRDLGEVRTAIAQVVGDDTVGVRILVDS